ncbi:MAG: DUF4838 domain-containing protein, partial [Verrucomicrobiae bacterium]|nr:DUF4838 domain-containing protein [Verrucomicrobiae bacterium]
ERGRLSNHVWDFVNRVAKEIGKTHPNAKVLNCAYGVYTLPPLNIEKLEPNVVVCIVGGRRPINKAGSKGEGESAPEALRAGWVKKTDNPILIFENYPFTDRGWYLPSFAPHAFGVSINATKGISQGEDIWLSAGRDFDTVGIGFNHFMVYFTARMYWGGKEQDVDTIYREYCRLFYGPAEKEILAFFDYCEANWLEMEKDKAKADRCLELFSLAQKKTDAESVYGKRLALIDDYLKGMRNKSQQLGQKRGPVPSLRLVGDASDIVIDGKLDEAYWENCPTAATGRLRELQTGRAPTFGTSIKAGWQSGNVYFAIRCDEHPGEKLNQGATQDDDAALWYGDAVEILLETESHSYYQIAVSPSGTITDVDRQGNQRQMQWDSKAEVATQIADDHWTIEIRIPVTQDENDPLHQVIGRQPTPSLPWHFNICRQRIRDNGAEYSAFSPTGTEGFHQVMKFAQFYDGKSTKFDAAPPEPDFLETNRVATDLARKGKHEDALTAFVAIAAGKVTDFQKSAALEQAAISARILKDFERAEKLAEQIPIEAVSKTVHMENLLGQRKAEELIAEFGEEKIESWPFWKTADGYDARGRAFSEVGNGDRAESDLTRALELVTDPADWLNLLMAIGINREKNLKDPTAALDAYRQMVTAKKNTGSATYYRGVQSAARLMQESGDFDGAIATLKQVDYGKLSGVWGGTFPLQVADTLLAAGKKEEALTTYQSVANNAQVPEAQRKMATDAIRNIRFGNIRIGK